MPFDQLSGVIAATTWPFTSTDLASTTFLNSYIHTYGELPGAVDAASYDSVKLIADALGKPGACATTSPALPNSGVQGVLKASDLGAGELSNNVAIVRLGELGAPQVLARYVGRACALTDTPAHADPTTSRPSRRRFPDRYRDALGVNLTIKQPLQNVRTRSRRQLRHSRTVESRRAGSRDRREH